MKLARFADPYFPNSSYLILPVFCWRDAGDVCIMLWTAQRVRKLGLAKELVQKLGIARVYHPLPESLPFWHHLGIPEHEK